MTTTCYITDRSLLKPKPINTFNTCTYIFDVAAQWYLKCVGTDQWARCQVDSCRGISARTKPSKNQPLFFADTLDRILPIIFIVHIYIFHIFIISIACWQNNTMHQSIGQWENMSWMIHCNFYFKPALIRVFLHLPDILDEKWKSKKKASGGSSEFQTGISNQNHETSRIWELCGSILGRK